jgi:hypothetical protein
MVATCTQAVRQGAGVPNTIHNGHMYSYLHDSGVVALRLPPGVREEFLATYNTKLSDLYGMVQKEYVLVPLGLLLNTEELAPYFAQSFEYVNSLKPKK